MKTKAIKPAKNINAEVAIPGSKSFMNRALICAALAPGTTRLQQASFCEDTAYMMEALRQFGVGIERDGTDALVSGTGGALSAPGEDVYVGAAGTTLRFLTTLAALAKGKTTLTGNKRMQERPIADLLMGLSQLGVKAKPLKGNGCPPVVVEGKGLRGGKIRIHGEKSSQYLTSLLLCAPYAAGEITIEIEGELTSKPYVTMTLSVMSEFGVQAVNYSYRRFVVRPGRYEARNYLIEADASGSSYFLAAAAVTGGTVRVMGLRPGSLQGDGGFSELLLRMGCRVTNGTEFIEVTGGNLKGIAADMNSMPDAVMTLAVVACFATGQTAITGIGNLKIKETDRIAATAAELRKLGAAVVTTGDSMTITPPASVSGARIATYDDHRMAMAFAVAGLAAKGMVIENPDVVGKSFPEYWELLEKLR